MRVQTLGRFALLSATSVLPFGALHAQSSSQPSTGEEPAAIGDVIIVTAQKLEQVETDVPITISAVSGEQIEELGVTDLDELSSYVPGLNIQEQSANNPGIVIRGVTSDSGSAQQGPRVTLYYNGVDISRSRGSYQAIYDLERVEVIKGPQATLFGTASAVGAISLVSAKPRPGFAAEITGGYGNFDQTLLSGFINAGSDTFGLRAAAEWRTRDGYVENLAESQEDELYAQDQLGARVSLRWRPTDTTLVDLVGTYDRQRNGGTPFVSGRLPAYAGAPGGAANAFESANLGGSPFSAQALGDDQLGLDRDVYDVNLTIEQEFGESLIFTTVNGYREFDSAEVFDADGSAAPFLEFAEIAEGWQISHEGRFSYVDPFWRAAFGWNFFREDGRQNVPFSTEEGTFLQCLTSLATPAPLIPGIPCVAPDGSVPASDVTALVTQGAVNSIPYTSVFENQGRNDSYSVFADVTAIPNEAIELTAGVRFLIEERRSAFLADVPASVITGAPLVPGQVDTGGETFDDERSFSAVLPRFNALFRLTPEVNIYGTVSKGRRSPVVQIAAAQVLGAPTQIVPEETVWNYEGGIKGQTGIIGGSLNVFYQQYDGFQVSVVQADGTSRTESAGSASNLGVEAEVTADPAPWLGLFLNGAYIDAKIDEDDAFSGAFSGARFRLQPKYQASGGFTIDAPISDDIRFFATPSFTYRSKLFFELPNSELLSQDDVFLVNVRAGASFADDRFEISGFVRNAFDEEYLLDAGNTGGAFGIPTFIPAEPRFYGIQLTARVGG
ncbi:TonB-dependent receptor [Erythrobacter litoralis]|uniref:TonB-dependent receptor n=1 Tax=Erythrobacter litoralis TaxID=39960 RepID=UPI0024348ECB|nr:TonB-dependent receptor [Erythrobacter litoralis]MDG6078946.1 TonB-dependent receptor [Erythrobacter litoralis]